MPTAALRTLIAIPSALLAFGALTACGGEGSSTKCSLDSCTVTFDRGVDASASVLGIEAELVSVQGDQVTLRVGGQTVTVPRGGDQQAEGFDVAVQSVTKDQVVVRIAHGAGG